MDTETARYEAATDLAPVIRLWREIGWLDRSDEQALGLEVFLGAGNATVARLDGEAECLVHWSPGTIRYESRDLPLCAVTAVTTSPVARKLRLASGLVAAALTEAHDAGMAVAALGMFEQGYYDRFGFGSGTYEHRVRFDPSDLTVARPSRSPVRITLDDHGEVHACLLRRHRWHGSLTLDNPDLMRSELLLTEDFFGYGYRIDGQLTHFLLGRAKDTHGPLTITFSSYETGAQLLDLLGLLVELGDQVYSVSMHEPPEIQLQDLLRRPIKQQQLAGFPATGGTVQSMAWWQLRVLDLERCVAARRWPGPPVRCVVDLHDPLARIDGATWDGISGTFVLEVGDPSTIEPGSASGLPTLRASINAFSRMWWGVRSASSLALTDDLSGPEPLLDALDESMRLPLPNPTWSF